MNDIRSTIAPTGPPSLGLRPLEASDSETRFRTMADCAPVLLWMAGRDGLCEFFNQGWLDFTGRGMGEEVGNGWAEGVHPEDFQVCMHTFLEAFVTRIPFSMEYRLRRHDGVYRWLFDQGAPRFSPSGEFVGYIGSCVDVTEQRKARETLSRLNRELEVTVERRTADAEEREVLIREVHHRVKNDLQLISSMLKMQRRGLAEPRAIRALEDSESRVQVIALIHEYMYQSATLAHMSLSESVRHLATNVVRIADPTSDAVKLSVDTDLDIELSMDRAIPCGLILNELITNALKHAFPNGQRGTVDVSLRRLSDRRVALTVADDGVGATEAELNASGSFGWRLIRAFADKLGAEVGVDQRSGTNVQVVFRE